LPFPRFGIAHGACWPFNSRDRLSLEGSIFLHEGVRTCVLAGATAWAFSSRFLVGTIFLHPSLSLVIPLCCQFHLPLKIFAPETPRACDSVSA
jgi:hypothetical protein